jgi:membrane-bound inhibitor of C-type lysozyme
VLYACDDRSTLAVRFSADGNQAFVERPGQPTLMLPRQVSGSGFLYETPQYTLRGKGDEAIWTVGRRVPVQCRVRS